MKLAKALKEKNKLSKDLNAMISRAVNNNSRVKGSVSHYNSKELMVDVRKKLDEYVQFKTDLFNASAEIREKIFRMSELRSLISSIKVMNTSEGMIKDRYDSGNPTEYEVTINAVEKDQMIADLEAEIDALQDEIDAFNARKDI